jgi:hypothetical protein
MLFAARVRARACFKTARTPSPDAELDGWYVPARPRPMGISKGLIGDEGTHTIRLRRGLSARVSSRFLMSLKTTIQTLAEKFAQNVIAALRGISLADLAELGGPAPGASARTRPAGPPTRRATAPASGPARVPRARKGARRDAASMQKIVDVIVSAVEKHPEGLRSEDLQRELGLRKKDLARPIQIALGQKALRKTGIKRATRYFRGR